jgi:hypothetical protein
MLAAIMPADAMRGRRLLLVFMIAAWLARQSIVCRKKG